MKVIRFSLLLSVTMRTSATGTVAINWEEHNLHFAEAFKELRDNGDFLDVTLVCDDEIQIKAHKNILSASSNFFRNVLRKNPHQHPLIYMNGLEHAVLVALVEFMYSGQVEIAQAYLDRFLNTAKDLKVKGLFEMQDRPTAAHGVAKVVEVNKKKDKIVNPLHNDPILAVGVDISSDITEENASVNNGDLDTNTTSTEEESESQCVKIENHYNFDEGLNRSNDFEAAVKMDMKDKKEAMIEKKDKMWHCKECGKIARQRCHIKNHVETHMNGISEDCNICGKSYKSRSVLNAHKTKHRNKADGFGNISVN